MAASKNLQEMRKQFKENKQKTVEEVKEPNELEAKLNNFANDFQEQVRADRSPSLNKRRFTNILAQKQKAPAKDSPSGADASDLFAFPRAQSEVVPEQVLPLEQHVQNKTAQPPKRRQKWDRDRTKSFLQADPISTQFPVQNESENYHTEQILPLQKPVSHTDVMQVAKSGQAAASRPPADLMEALVNEEKLSEEEKEPREVEFQPSSVDTVKQQIHNFDLNLFKSSPTENVLDLETPSDSQLSSVRLNDKQLSFGQRHGTERSSPEVKRVDQSLLGGFAQGKLDMNWYVYVVSGYCDSPLASLERLQLQKSSIEGSQVYQQQCLWEEMEPVLTPRTKFQTVYIPSFKLYEDKPEVPCLFVLGGKNGSSQRIDTIEIYDPRENKWLSLPNIKMRKAKSGFASVLVSR